MTNDSDFEIFLATVPGLEPVLAEEVRLKGFKRPKTVPGGVVTRGGWPEVWRANLWIRGAGSVLARIASFHVVHMAQLDTLAHRVPWAEVLRRDVPFRVEAVLRGVAPVSQRGGGAADRDRDPRHAGRAGIARRRGGGDGAHREGCLHPQHRYLGRAAAQARLQGGGERRAAARDHGRAVPAAVRL